jgi:hypothetical protein
MTLGLTLFNRNLVVSLPNKFWYPIPAPFKIRPRSLNGPHEADSGLANGMCVIKILGSCGLAAI